MPDPLNNSYYAATSNAWETQPSFVGDSDYDVAVIGGGFTGLSAALACAEKGLKVALLEAKTIGFGASGRNGGQLIPGLRWSMREIDSEFGRERAKAIFDLAYCAVDRVQSRIAIHNIQCDLKPGHLETAYKPAHFEAMQRDAEFLAKEFGWESEIVAAKDLGKHIQGGGYHGGLYDNNGGHFHPLNYALGLAQAALKAGVHILENAPVGMVLPTGTPYEVCFGGHTLFASNLVVATDTWTNEIGLFTGDDLPDLGRYTIPIMNYNVATAPLANADQLLPSDAAIADSR